MGWNTPQISPTIWVELKSIMLSEKVRQRKTNMTSFHLQVEHKKQTKKPQMNKQNKRETDS